MTATQDQDATVRQVPPYPDRPVDESERLEGIAQRRSHQLQGLAKAALVIARAPTLEATLNEITAAARAIVGAHQAVVSLTRAQDWSQAINAVQLTERYAQWRDYAEVPDGSGIYAWVCEQNRPVRLTQAELEAHPRWRAFGSHAGSHPPMRGWLAAPLIGRDGRNLGLIQLSDKEDGGEFDADDEAVLVQLAGVAAAAVERTLTEEALRESEARFRHMADSAPALIWMTDAQGVVTFANMHYDFLFGCPASTMTGDGWRDIVLPEDLPGFERAFQDAFAQRHPFTGEVRVRDRHGDVRWLRCDGVARFDDRGTFLGYTGCNIDITGAKVADAALRELNATLETRVVAEVMERAKAEDALRQAQKMEAVGQLTGGVAHDFNNLLTIIRSSVDLLGRENLPEERRRRYVDAIADTVDRAAKLTGQLLAFARRQALKPEVFDVPERIRGLSDMLRTIMGARVTINMEVACERCFAEADISQFETALVNMAVNARDAMEGEGTLTVRVATLDRMPALRGHAGGPGGFVAVSLTDTGSGIPPERLNQIFEPFFTTKEVGKGTGLGLSQVYGFAKQSGGDVAVESEVGRGSTFTLYLPRVAREPAPEQDQADEREPAEADRHWRILVVEDNVEVGRFSTQILQDLGHETTWAANAAEALQVLEEQQDRIDAVFTDVVMPGMSGVELGQEIRRRYPRLPVVLTSGYSHVLAEEGRHGFELLQKPYAVEELSRMLCRVIGARGR